MLEALRYEVQVHRDGGQWVVDLMGDARGQRPDRRHAIADDELRFDLPQRIFGLPPSCAIRHHGEHAHMLTICVPNGTALELDVEL